MVRVVKDYTVRRNEILDVAQRLMVTAGYEQMTIQDILDSLGISKGAFYHYFSSKQELLEAIIERMLGDAEKLLAPLLNDSTLPALVKFERFFSSVADWKTAQKSFVLALLKVWYQDDNAIVRQKLRVTMVQHVSPLIAAIIRQGNQEGVMAASDPDQAGEVALQLVYDLSDTVGLLLLSYQSAIDSLGPIAAKIAAYTEAIERVLGARPYSLYLVDTEVMRQWAVSIEPVQA
jgi:AcrR family transcriptional regulator